MWRYNRSLRRPVILVGPNMLKPGSSVVRLSSLEPHNPECHGKFFLSWKDPKVPDCFTSMLLSPQLVQVAARRTRIIHPTRPDVKLEVTEHLFAALAILGINTALITIELGDEVPLFDGSVQPILEHLLEAGVYDLPSLRKQHRVTTDVRVGEPEGPHVRVNNRYQTEPTFTAIIDFSNKIDGWRHIGRQQLGPLTLAQLQDYAAARSFGVAWQGALAQRLGLIYQDPAHYALQYRSNGELTRPEMRRFPNEEVAHKLLDFVGDLSLVWGGNIPVAQYTAHMAGHALHIMAARQLSTEPMSEKIAALR